jgi:hypothetical protein
MAAFLGKTTSLAAEINARATAKSAAGSLIFKPTAIFN